MTALQHEPSPAGHTELRFLWLEVTGRCQASCRHCYADSSPSGTDGTMRPDDWIGVLDQAADLGVTMVQFIGGEPTLYTALPELITHALGRQMQVEVYSNLVHVTPAMWKVLAQPGVRLATSFYSDDPAQHRQITGRGTLARIQANITHALHRDIPLRVGIIDLGDGQRVEAAHALLSDLGVSSIGLDRMRLLGRPATTPCDASQLCGRCGDGIAAVLPDGTLTPCPMARWLPAGSVHTDTLAHLATAARRIAETQITPMLPHACRPPCEPQCTPGCNPGVDQPGGGDGCQPKMNCNPNSSCKPQEPCQPDVSCKPR